MRGGRDFKASLEGGVGDEASEGAARPQIRLRLPRHVLIPQWKKKIEREDFRKNKKLSRLFTSQQLVCVWVCVCVGVCSCEGIYSPVYRSVKDARMFSVTRLMMYSSLMKQGHTHKHTYWIRFGLRDVCTEWFFSLLQAAHSTLPARGPYTQVHRSGCVCVGGGGHVDRAPQQFSASNIPECPRPNKEGLGWEQFIQPLKDEI